MSSLAPCVACHRHVQSSDAACPFCGSTSARAAPPPRLDAFSSRLALVMGIGGVTVACAAGDGSTGAPLGADPADAGATAAIVDASDAGGDGSFDAGSAVAMYGAPGCDVAPPANGGGAAAPIAVAVAAALAVSRSRRS